MQRMQYARRLIAVLAAILCGVAAGAAQPPPTDPAITELRRELEQMKQTYEDRIRELEGRLAALEQERRDQPRATAGDELQRLRAAARDAATAGPSSAPTIEIEEPAIGRERNLNRLNPEISLTGIVLANNDQRNEFSADEVELDVQSALDPFSRVRVTLGIGEEGAEVEEAWVAYSSLPGGLELLAGKFRQRFGALNRQHVHALPQTEYPLAYTAYFGDEGLAQTGLSFTWLLPRPWATANELTLEITDGENEEAFAGEEFRDLSVLGRLKNFWELSPAAYLEWGVSGVAGKTATDGDSRIWGTDLTYHWQPPARAKYRSLTWRGELLRSEREDPLGIDHKAWGLYTYLEGLLARNLIAGVRFDQVEDPLDPSREVRGATPYLTWWQSEYVRLRAEYSLLEDRVTGETDDRFTLQLTWAAGPHKHETY